MTITKEIFDPIFKRLLESQCFAWKCNKNMSIEDKNAEASSINAETTVKDFYANIKGGVSDVVMAISKKAETWGYKEYLDRYTAPDDLNLFITELTERQVKLKEETESPDKWMVINLLYEARKLSTRKKRAETEIEKIKQRVLLTRQKRLKTTPTSDEYKDEYNKETCKLADKLDIRLPEAKIILDQQLSSDISEQYLIEQLTEEYRTSKLKSLKISLEGFIKNGIDPEKAIKLCCILFEIDLLKTDDIWRGKKFTDVLIKGLSGGPIELITMLCLINNFDYRGGYSSETDIFAYKRNSKLEAIPLIVDEMTLLPEFFSFYGIDTSLTIYIADTDYTEIGEFGPVNDLNIKNIDQYISNIRQYLAKFSNIRVAPISEVTSNNDKYQEVKTRVYNNVKGFKDIDFSREWWQKFENDVERRFESQTKRKLFPKDQIRAKTLELTRNIWACNAAQGVVFGTLGENTILVSTERRERDQNYTIDKSSRENFPPVLYILKAAEEWNRKLTARAST